MLDPVGAQSSFGPRQKPSSHVAAAEGRILILPPTRPQVIPIPVRTAFEPFSWLHKLDWKMMSQFSTHSDLIRVTTTQSDNLFYASATSLQELYNKNRTVTGFAHIIASIMNNLDQHDGVDIGEIHQWLGSLPLPILRRFFKELPPLLFDIIRQQVFKAAMKRNDEITVRTMLELGYDAREEIIVDTRYWQHPVSPLFRALRLGQFAISKTLVAHLSRIEDETGCQGLLQVLTAHGAHYPFASIPFTLDEWTDLMRILFAKGAAPTVQCFELLTKSEIDRLLSGNTTIAWVEKGLVAAALRRFDGRCAILTTPGDDYLRTKHIVTSILGSDFEITDYASPKLRLALSEAMEIALDGSEFWAVELIHLAGLRLDSPLVSATYKGQVKSAIDEAWLTGQWNTVHQLLNRLKAPYSKPDDICAAVDTARTQAEFDTITREVGDYSVLGNYVLAHIMRNAARLDREDVAVKAIRAMQEHTDIADRRKHAGLYRLLQYRHIAAVSKLIVADERFARALHSRACPGDFIMLETLMYRSHTMRGHRYFPDFIACAEPCKLQLALRGLAYHALHVKDGELLEWLISNGLETDELNPDDIGGFFLRDEPPRYHPYRGALKDRFPSLLSIAARRNDKAMLRILIQGGAKCIDSDALKEAVAAKADMVTINMLLSAADSCMKRQYGVGALRAAIHQGNHALVRHLVNYVDTNGYASNEDMGWTLLSPLGEAIKCHDCISAQFLINAGVSAEKMVTWNRGLEDCALERLTPLLAAIFVNDQSMIEVLTNSGAEIDYGPKLGLLRTPLQYAAELGRFNIVQALLSKGVPVDSAPFFLWGNTTATGSDQWFHQRCTALAGERRKRQPSTCGRGRKNGV